MPNTCPCLGESAAEGLRIALFQTCCAVVPTEWGKFPFKAAMESIQMFSLSSSAPAPEAACYSSCQDPLGKPATLTTMNGVMKLQGRDCWTSPQTMWVWLPALHSPGRGSWVSPSTSQSFPLQICNSAWQPCSTHQQSGHFLVFHSVLGTAVHLIVPFFLTAALWVVRHRHYPPFPVVKVQFRVLTRTRVAQLGRGKAEVGNQACFQSC